MIRAAFPWAFQKLAAAFATRQVCIVAPTRSWGRRSFSASSYYDKYHLESQPASWLEPITGEAVPIVSLCETRIGSGCTAVIDAST